MLFTTSDFTSLLECSRITPELRSSGIYSFLSFIALFLTVLCLPCLAGFSLGAAGVCRGPLLQLRCTSFSMWEAAALGRAGSVALTPRFCRCERSACVKAFNPHSLVSPSQGGMERSPILFTHWLCISEKIVIPSSLNQCSHLKIGAMQSQWDN